MNQGKKRRAVWARRSVQIIFFLFIFGVVFSHYAEKSGIDVPWPVLHNFHAICPFGAVETAGRLVMDGSFIPKIHESNLWVFAGVMAVTLLFGAVFCGWLCPLGSVQEWIGAIGKKIFKKRYNRFIGEKADRMLGYLRYAVLALVVLKTTQMVALVFQRVDPYYALFHFWMGDVLPSAMIVLGAVLSLSLFFERPWCRWFCPFGALIGVVQLLSPWKIRRNSTECSACGACSRTCPMRIPLEKKNVVFDTRCNRCGNCLSVCPKESGMSFSFSGAFLFPMKRKLVTGALIVLVFAAPILFAHAGGFFATSQNEKARRGKIVVEEIKGTMTMEDIARGMGLDSETLRQVLGVEGNVPESTKLYDLEDLQASLTLKTVKQKLSEYLVEVN
jgi:ferredoxin